MGGTHNGRVGNGGDDRAQRARLRECIVDLITRLSDGSRDDTARDALLKEALAMQARAVPPYARLCASRRRAPNAARPAAGPAGPAAWPALPTDVFRFARVAAHPETQDSRVFRTSGTTSGARGQHFIRDLSLYDTAARAAASHALFPDRQRLRLVALISPTSETPDSSLSYMVDRFFDWFGDGDGSHAFADGKVDVDALSAALTRACAERVPVAVLATSFALVHADEALGERLFALPAGSRVMQTGGFKGKSRQLSPIDMQSMVCRRYGVTDSHVVQEYGMTELCSQMYEHSLRAALQPGAPRQPDDARSLWVPGWVRATPVNPHTLLAAPEGATGLLRIDDLANLDTLCAIQTSDLARQTTAGLQLLGRASGAVPRGCSLAVEEALGNA